MILSTPQISVTLNLCDMIEVDTAFIGEDFQSRRAQQRWIPLAQVEDLASSMLAILRRR